MSDERKKIMVKIRFEGRDLANCDFWTKSDPYLLITRPPRAGKGFINVSIALIHVHFIFASQTLYGILIFV